MVLLYIMESSLQDNKDYNFPVEKFCDDDDNDTIMSSNYKICLAIPNSVKHILWYLSLQNKNIIFSMECNKIIKVPPYNDEPYFIGETKSSLLNDTKLMGTMIPSSKEGVHFFVIEDIGTFRGKNIQNHTFGEKLVYMKELLNLHSKIEDFLGIILVLPFFWENGCDIPYEYIPYPFEYIQYRTLENNEPYLNKIIVKDNLPIVVVVDAIDAIDAIDAMDSIKYRQIFEVKSTLQSDIYELYAYDKKNQSIFYDIAYIPNCKSSMYMNILFMDDETNVCTNDYFTDVFENKRIDTKKTLIMECVYHIKFQRWVPIKVLTFDCKNKSNIVRFENLPIVD